MIEAALIILFFGYCQRVQGGWNPYGNTFIWNGLSSQLYDGEPIDVHRKVIMFLYGFVIGFYLSDDWRVWTATSILWYLGERKGWRQIFNELSDLIPEQPHLFFRFMFRGFIYAIPAMLIPIIQYFFSDHVDYDFLILLSMAIAFPFSGYIGYKGQKYFDRHSFTEWTRGLIFGLFFVQVLLQ